MEIILGYDENNNQISKDRTLYGDPLKPYKDPNGNYIDSDEDNIPDIVESLLSNNSTFAKFTRLLLNPSSPTYNQSLYLNYSWCIAYFYSVRNGKDFWILADDINTTSLQTVLSYITAWEFTQPINKSAGENSTEWLTDQFNPLIRDTMPPVLVDFAVKTLVDYVAFIPTSAHAKIAVILRDPSGIDKVKISTISWGILSGIVVHTKTFQFNGETHVTISTKLDITVESSALTYNVSVCGTDMAGNSAEWYKEVDGISGALIKTLAKLLDALWGFLCEVGKTLAKAFEILAEWLRELIDCAFKTVAESIKSMLGGLTSSMSRFIKSAVHWMGTSKLKSRNIIEDVFNALEIFMEAVKGFGLWFMGMFLTITTILGVIKIVIGGLGALVDMVTNEIIKEEILPMLLVAVSYDIVKDIMDITGTNHPLKNLMSWVGLSGAEAEKIYMLADVQKAKLNGKVKLLGYYIGLALALSGLLAPLIIPTLNLDYNGTIKADGICIGIAVGGFIYSMLLSKKDKTVDAKNTVSPTVHTLEIILGIMGITAAVIKTVGDLHNGGG